MSPRNFSQQQIQDEIIPKIAKSFPSLQKRVGKYNQLSKLLKDKQIDLNIVSDISTLLNSDSTSEEIIDSIQNFLTSRQNLPVNVISTINSILSLKQNQTERLQAAFSIAKKEGEFSEEEQIKIQNAISITAEDYLR